MTFLSLLLAGGRLLLGRRPTASDATPGQFWAMAVLAALMSCALSYVDSESPRYFNISALQTQSLFLVLALLLGGFAAWLAQARDLLWTVATLALAAGIWIDGLFGLIYWLLLPAMNAGAVAYWSVWFASLLWTGLVVLFLFHHLLPGRRGGAVAAAAGYCLALYGVVAGMDTQSFWAFDYAAYYAAEDTEQPPPLVAETLLYRQPALLDKQLNALAPERPGVVDMYFISFGSYGDEAVFKREVAYSGELFRSRLGGQGRTLTLVNHRSTLAEQPMATVTNLQRSLEHIAGLMNPQEDILFVFLTSHGSRDHALAVNMANLSLLPLPAERLAALLDATGMPWQVVVVSACYSGGFVAPLHDPQRLIITAASADRTSFGCSDEAEMTYFGRAFLEEGLGQTRDFEDAFEIALQAVEAREAADDFEPSKPRIDMPEAMRDKLAAWRRQWPDTLSHD